MYLGEIAVFHVIREIRFIDVFHLASPAQGREWENRTMECETVFNGQANTETADMRCMREPHAHSTGIKYNVQKYNIQ